MTGPDPPDDDGYKWRAFGAIGMFFVTAVLIYAMVFVALPAMADDFGVTLRAASWVIIAHALTISALLLPMGRLADQIGRRRIHLAGLVCFAAGCVLVAAAPTFGFLLAARVVMGIGDAMSQSVGTGMLVSVFPPGERGTAIGSQTTAVAVGAAIGPVVAGVVLQAFSWRVLFLVMVVPIVMSFVAGHRILDEERVSQGVTVGQTFDRGGALWSALAIAALAITLNNPFGLPWASPAVAAMAIAVVSLFALFTRHELRHPAPMFQLRFFADRRFAAAVAARAVGFVGSAAVYILVPVFLISLQARSESSAGLVLFVNSMGLGVAAQAAGRLSDRFGARRFALGGFAIMIVTSLSFASMDAATPLSVVVLTALGSGVAVGSWNVTNNATIIGSVPPSAYGVMGAFTNLIRNVGNVFGQALVAALVAGIMAARGFDIPLGELADTAGAGAAFVAGWRAAFVVVAVLAAVGCGLSALAPGRR
ncbi:MAG: MFS transporter [Acidimicrobiales bacterium]